MTIGNMRKRLDKLAGPPVSQSAARDAALREAFAALRHSTVARCGRDRDSWLQRVAHGSATDVDKEVLRWLPRDALATIGMTPRQYAQLMHRTLKAF